MVKERPILFSGEMVRAILGGRKTQTRRVLVPTQTEPKIAPLRVQAWIIDGERQIDDEGRQLWEGHHPDYPVGRKLFSCPYGQAGERLWVRETWARWDGGLAYLADSLNEQGTENEDSKRCRLDYSVKWKPSIHMPRWASRVTLQITSVRAERVQDISDDDAIEEGVDRTNTSIPTYARQRFQKLWDSINAKRGYGWATNPWVWVISFKGLEQ